METHICPCCGSIKKDSNKVNESFTCDCLEQKRLMTFYMKTNIPYEYWDKDLSSFTGKETYKQEIQDYCDNIDKYYKHSIGMFLWGKNGTGKTLLSVCILKHTLSKKYKCFFVSYSEIVKLFTSGWKSDSAKFNFEKNIQNSDFLIIDDLGKEFKTQNNLAESILDNVIRYRRGPTIVTSNQNAETLRTLYGDTFGNSLASLIYGKMLHIHIIGSDYRGDQSSKLKEIVKQNSYRILK